MSKSKSEPDHRVVRVADSVAHLRREYPVTGGIGWDFDGFRVWVDSNEPALLTELASYFTDFRQLEADSLEMLEDLEFYSLLDAVDVETNGNVG